MPTNTNLTQELAAELVKGREVLCPNCGEQVLISRYRHKNQNTEYKCPACGELYHPCRLL